MWYWYIDLFCETFFANDLLLDFKFGLTIATLFACNVSNVNSCDCILLAWRHEQA